MVFYHQLSVIERNGLKSLIQSALDTTASLEARRYCLLGISSKITNCNLLNLNHVYELLDLSATPGMHMILIYQNVLSLVLPLFSIDDIMSQYYIACIITNLSLSFSNYDAIISNNGLKTLYYLSEINDIDTYAQCIIALRNLSTYESIKSLITEENGLKVLKYGLESDNISQLNSIIQDLLACLSNLSVNDENKIKIVNYGFKDILTKHLYTLDEVIVTYACSTIANLVEASSCQDCFSTEGINYIKYNKHNFNLVSCIMFLI